MNPLKLLGLSVLAGICILALFAGYRYYQESSMTSKIRKKGLKLHNEINHVMITGENRRISMKVPDDYSIIFDNRSFKIDDFRYPDDGNYSVPLEGSKVKNGEHELLLFFENGKLMIEEQK